MKRIPLLLTVVSLPILGLGCGGAKPSGDDPEIVRRKEDLAQIYELYAQFWKRNERPPKQMADLTRKEDETLHPAGVRAMREGAYVVVWGVSGTDSGKILAYEKDAPTQGGFVLMADGGIGNMSADDLKARL